MCSWEWSDWRARYFGLSHRPSSGAVWGGNEQTISIVLHGFDRSWDREGLKELLFKTQWMTLAVTVYKQVKRIVLWKIVIRWLLVRACCQSRNRVVIYIYVLLRFYGPHMTSCSSITSFSAIWLKFWSDYTIKISF